MNAPKCPKAKAVFRAVSPDGEHVLYRSSARDYSHALAIHEPAKPAWADRRWIHKDRGEVVPEGFEVISYGLRNGAEDRNVAFVGRRMPDKPAGWGVVSFHSSAALADKAAASWHRVADGYQVVEAELVEDRRQPR